MTLLDISPQHVRYLSAELEKAQGELTILRRQMAQIDAALKMARSDLDADEWPEGLAACDVIDKYLVSPAVTYIGELENENDRLRAAIRAERGPTELAETGALTGTTS